MPGDCFQSISLDLSGSGSAVPWVFSRLATGPCVSNPGSVAFSFRLAQRGMFRRRAISACLGTLYRGVRQPRFEGRAGLGHVCVSWTGRGHKEPSHMPERALGFPRLRSLLLCVSLNLNFKRHLRVGLQSPHFCWEAGGGCHLCIASTRPTGVCLSAAFARLSV